MALRHISILLTLLVGLTLAACDRQDDSTTLSPATPAAVPRVRAEDAQPRQPFRDSMEAERFELPSGALSVWRQYADIKPTLLLFSAHPLLDPLPEDLTAGTRELVLNGAAEEIIRRGKLTTPAPQFVSPQAVSAALVADLFSEIVYVFPTLLPVEQFSLETFRQRAFAAGFFSEEEALALTLADGVISGSVRGVPFRCVHPAALPAISTPTLLHIDLGYFKELYVNEVKTPVYHQTFDLARAIRDTDIPCLAATLSYSNQEIGFSLDVRFVIDTLAALFKDPSQIDGTIPETWKLRSDALYLNTMFLEEEGRSLIKTIAEKAPDDAAAQYALAMLRFQQKENDEAFATLDHAVALDPGYVQEYLSLAEQGQEIQLWEKSLELLDKAARVEPDNPYITLRRADTLIRAGRGKEALPLLEQLSRLPWSPDFHADIPALLKEMEDVARENPPPQTRARQGNGPAHGMMHRPPHKGAPGN